MFKKLLCILVALSISSCAQKSKDEPNKSWPENMQDLAEALTDLLPYVFDKEEFENPKNEKRIKNKIEEFRSASHMVPQKTAGQILGKDPLVSMSIDNLNAEIDSSLEAFKRGNYKYSRSLLQHTVNYCFACHTRSHFGPKYDYWNLKSLSNAKMTPLERARVYVATRQFDGAKDIISENLLDGFDTYDNPYMQEKAIKQYLSIVVRVDESPQEGHRFVSQLAERHHWPVYMQRNFENWQVSFLNWMSESKKSKSFKLKKAKSLVSGKSLGRAIYDNDSRFVDYLRASTIFHSQLASPIKGQGRAEIYYYLGQIYNHLVEAGFWELPEQYFEACIHEAPKSKISRKCYRSYEQNIVIGFSGSSGTFIPEIERKKLVKLKSKAGFEKVSNKKN